MRSLALTAPLLLVALACTRAEKVPPADVPVAQRDPAVTPDAATDAPGAIAHPIPDTRGWAGDWPKAWTDRRVVAALAEDCRFVPVRPRTEGESSGDIPPDLFACSLGYSQSCNPDPCSTPSSACEHTCEQTCGGCGGACITSCTTCKDACADVACKNACATTCAECHQTCTRTMDRCVTGSCNKVHTQCTARLRAVWASANCQSRCAVYQRCIDSCSNGTDGEACNERCEAKLSPGGKACRERCDVLRDTDPRAADLCIARCFETAPCASLLCQAGWGKPP